MATNPNTPLLQAAHGTPSDTTPAKLAGDSQVTTFESKNVAPPSPLYIQRDDVLFVTATSNIVPATITVTARLLLAGENRIQTIQDTLRLTTAYTSQFKSIALAEGYLLSLTIQVPDVASPLPFAYASCVIVRGASANIAVQPGQVLVAGYISTDTLATWPGGSLLQGTEGNGYRRVVTIANPAAGADWSATPGQNAVWEVASFVATLTTAVAAANRQVQVEIVGPGGFIVFRGTALANIVASTTANVCGAQMTPYTPIVATNFVVPISLRNKLFGSDLIRTTTVNIQAADQWSNIALEVNEWLLT